MITLTRRQARTLRAVLRRRLLGAGPRGPVPPLVFVPDPGVGLRVRYHHPGLAVEHVLEGPHEAAGAIALPLDALADLEGTDASPVVLDIADGRSVARWLDRGVPRSKEYHAPEPAGLPPFPDAPADFAARPGDLLDALAEAAATTDEGSKRYALECVLLRGADGSVVATDGRQLLTQGGFAFPWGDDLLVRPAPLFAAKALPRDLPILVGRTETHVAVRAGAWTVWLGVRADARFPRVEGVFPPASAVTARLRLDPADAAFLALTLDRLPGSEEINSPVTFDLNGRVSVRARGPVGGRTTELVLTRSAYTGAPVRVNVNRDYLARAARLGLTALEVADAGSPVVFRDGRRAYAVQPLSEDSGIGPSEDAVCLESAPPAVAPAVRPPREAALSEPDLKTKPPAPAAGPNGAGPADGGGDGGLAALVREAGELHTALADAKARAGRLAAALRRHRRRERLVHHTLASLRALKLQDVVG